MGVCVYVCMGVCVCACVCMCVRVCERSSSVLIGNVNGAVRHLVMFHQITAVAIITQTLHGR
jgi:hypothetical protein